MLILCMHLMPYGYVQYGQFLSRYVPKISENENYQNID